MSKVEQHDLVKYGLMPELIGRLPIITALNPLSEDDLVHILTEPKNAMQKIMFDVPDMAMAKRVVVTATCVEGKEDALVYGARNKKIA